MSNNRKDLNYKLKEFPLVRYNMLEHSVFERFLSMATKEQLEFCENFFNNNVEILFNESSAGCGKTMCSVACAYADWLNKGKKLVFVISPVAEDLGSRPGNQTEKELAYFMGLHDAILELNMYPEQVIKEMVELQENNKDIDISQCWVSQISHLFLRGGNLKDCTVIINEAQNFKRSELKKVLTRLHSDSKCIVEGNYRQIDLKNISKSGFEPYVQFFKDHNYSGAAYHTFHENFRSRLANFADSYNWK